MASGVRRSCSGSSGALGALLFRHLGFSKFSPTFTRLSSSIPPSTLRSLSKFPKLFLQSFTSPGKRLLPGCFAGIGMAAAIICHPPTTAYAMDDYKVESSGGDVTEDFDTLWALARKYQLPLVMLVMLLLGWRHPLITAINAVFFLFSTRPSPFSIYLVVEHVCVIFYLFIFCFTTNVRIMLISDEFTIRYITIEDLGLHLFVVNFLYCFDGLTSEHFKCLSCAGERCTEIRACLKPSCYIQGK